MRTQAASEQARGDGIREKTAPSLPLFLLLSQSSLLRVGFGEALAAGEQRLREPPQRCMHPSMGGSAAVERLDGGALPTRALTDRGPSVILLPAAPPL
jgi:hypothetical protein